MKKILVFLFGMILSMIMVGCGHTVIHRVDGTGLYGRVPLPDGSSLVEVAIGNLSITSGVLRGGATYNEDSSKGGTFGTVSTANHIQVTTQPAMNEGYMAEVFTSETTDPATKQKLAEYLISRKQQVPTPAAASSVNASAGTGENPPDVKPVSTGIDNIVNKTAEAAPKIVEPIVDATKESVSDVKDTATTVVDGVKSVSKYVIVGIVILAIMIILIMFFYYRWKKKHGKSTESKTDERQVEASMETVSTDIPASEEKTE